MKNFFLVFFTFIFCGVLTAQELRRIEGGFGGFNRQTDSLANEEISVKLNGKTKYTDYKIINRKYDTTYVDTTLTIQKEYKFNFLRKDNFELLAFHNQGQTFNNLAYDFNHSSLFPDIGFRAKQFSYFNVEDINYYQVATPTSEILYRTGQEQGQVLDALFTLNFSPRLNVSLAYKGLRSLGQYRRSLASTGNFRATLSYSTPKKQYAIRTHYTSQDIMNQESGGLTAEMLQNFINNSPDFTDRGRLDVNLSNTETIFEGTRFYLDQNYKLFASKDSTNTKDFSNLKVGHELTTEQKSFSFNQTAVSKEVFGNASTTAVVKDSLNYSITNNQLYLEFNSKYILGKFRTKANYTNVTYGYDSIFNVTKPTNKIKLRGSSLSLGADWSGKIGNFYVNADATLVPGSGHLAGNSFNGEAFYKKDSVFTIKGRLATSSKAPNFNMKLFQSRYDKYNWTTNFENIDTQNLGFQFLSKWGNATLDFTTIQDYVYFNENNLPQQFNGTVVYLKLKANKELKAGKFALNNTVMYQNVSSGSDVFRVPEFVTRNTLYYTDEWFKGKPLLVNIGITFNYFTKYKANAYNPLLAEFTLQNTTEIGYPTVDVFFNARVRRTRLYFKIDNLSSRWSSKNYFSAPSYPYRDMSIRFGLVWNWFI